MVLTFESFRMILQSLTTQIQVYSSYLDNHVLFALVLACLNKCWYGEFVLVERETEGDIFRCNILGLLAKMKRALTLWGRIMIEYSSTSIKQPSSIKIYQAASNQTPETTVEKSQRKIIKPLLIIPREFCLLSARACQLILSFWLHCISRIWWRKIQSEIENDDQFWTSNNAPVACLFLNRVFAKDYY